METKTTWLNYRKKILKSCFIAGFTYFVVTFIFIHFDVLSTQESIANIPVKDSVVNKLNNLTTTTTPTPLIYYANVKNILAPKMFIEKFDAMKIHADIVKRKLFRMSGVHNKSKRHSNFGPNIINETVHMFYSDIFTMNKVCTNKKTKHQKSVASKNDTVNIIKQNLDLAGRAGAGVIFVSGSQDLITLQNSSKIRTIFDTLFRVAPEHGLKIGLAIKHFKNRNIMSVLQILSTFIMTYKNEKALFVWKKDEQRIPVIYIMSSYLIPYGEWMEILSPKRKLSIRNNEKDAIVFGELRDREHISHVRLSRFNGFFTKSVANGETFASTWKNWRILNTWAHQRGLLWSAGISGGVQAAGVALRTALKCCPRPTFVTLSDIPLLDEYFALTQSWIRQWSNSSAL